MSFTIQDALWTLHGHQLFDQTRQVISHLLNILISRIKHSHHLLHRIFITLHITSIFSMTRFPILERNIWPNPIIFVAIVVPIVVVVAIVAAISNILNLSIVIVIVQPLIFLTFISIIYVRTLGFLLETTCLIIHRIRIFLIINSSVGGGNLVK